MTVHLLKLAVGAESVDDIRSYQKARMATLGIETAVPVFTRRSPRRVDDVLDGGSLYWVVRGVLSVRQRVLDLRLGADPDGRARCEIWLDPRLVATRPVPWRPFQGWRYLASGDAPADTPGGASDGADPGEALPTGLAGALDSLGVR